jgi:hypothetical protein
LSAPIVIDDSRWPLVLITLPAGDSYDDAAVREFVDALPALHARGRFGVVYDAAHFVAPTRQQRRWIADSINDTQRRFPDRLVAVALATRRAPVLTAVLRAIGWLAPQKEPRRVFDDVEAATAWVLEHLAAADTDLR